MRLTTKQYPTKWRWRFALFPTYFGEHERIWLEFYQCRHLGGLNYERRDRTGKTVEFCYYP